MNAPQPDFVTKVTLRSRLIAAMVLLAGLALLSSGIIVALLQHQAILENVDHQLSRTRDELRVLATKGVDPDTGNPFAGPSELLHTFLARTVIGGAENVEEKTPLELFGELYEKQNGMPLSDEQARFSAGLIESIWEGRV